MFYSLGRPVRRPRDPTVQITLRKQQTKYEKKQTNQNKQKTLTREKITVGTKTGITETKRWEIFGGFLAQINAKPAIMSTIS